uniref:ABC transporter domain-containing protein n=1 Tax=Ditylenchus dipsaci TaxID=166011 RepID=A0A915D5R6_9BILA
MRPEPFKKPSTIKKMPKPPGYSSSIKKVAEKKGGRNFVGRRRFSGNGNHGAEWYSPNKPPKNWPHSGEISIRNLCCPYRPELKLSLRNITANIRLREKIGVVGRTGSGKTSLSLALSKITVIPQDSVLFSGTLRFNLDPFNVSTDAELWTALEHAHLKTL